MKPNPKDFLWMAAGAAFFGAIVWLVMSIPPNQTPAARLALKDRKIELVDQMRLALASASEAEKSAVLATTDEDSQTFAGQARAATVSLEQERAQLGEIMRASGSPRENELLAEFSKTLADLERIDHELLGLAVQNTNLKAYRLAFGPAADILKEADDALAHIVQARADSDSPGDKPVILLADDARISSLRILALLPPHIAEESDQKMDEMEARMAREDRAVRKDLADLAATKGFAEDSDLATAVARYASFTDLRSQILKLSRENTNVRSLAISLNEKRKAMFLCQDELSALEQAIQQEFVSGTADLTPVNPR
ncbi:MAG TPA: hypothetical protein VNV15_10300 [Opitutaceae bacterium]|nr:hypothetical protein [Opitutaceae bacterium]